MRPGVSGRVKSTIFAAGQLPLLSRSPQVSHQEEQSVRPADGHWLPGAGGCVSPFLITVSSDLFMYVWHLEPPA